MKTKTCITFVCFCTWFISSSAREILNAETPHAAAHAAAGAASAQQDASDELVVAVGKSVLVDLAKPIQRISLGFGEIAEASAMSPSEVLINGKAAGETSLIVWEAGGGRHFFNIKVLASNAVANDQLEAIRRELRMELPGQEVRVNADNGNIFLRGSVKDLTSSDRAVQIASTAGKVVNLLYVDVPATEPQILLKVRFASIDLTQERQLGLNLYSLGATNSIGSVSTGQFSPPTVTASGGTATVNAPPLNINIYRPDLALGATLQALETKGVVQVLAEPNLLVENKKQASFLAGGQYPYPVVQGVGGGSAGAVTIQFQQFGVRLNFIPTIMPGNQIHLQVAPEVSALDYSNGVTISGFTVPGIDIRKVNTDVDLSEGESFVIGGLLDNRVTQSFQKIPFIGDIPVLGKFFQSIQRTKNNTELIVIVTPVIVPPIPNKAPLPELKYPVPFLTPSSGIPMSNPDGHHGGDPAALPQAQPTIPVEKLVQLMQPEQPLQGAGASNGSSASSGGQSNH